MQKIWGDFVLKEKTMGWVLAVSTTAVVLLATATVVAVFLSMTSRSQAAVGVAQRAGSGGEVDCAWVCDDPACTSPCFATCAPVPACTVTATGDEVPPSSCRIRCPADMVATESCPTCEVVCDGFDAADLTCGTTNCAWDCEAPVDCEKPTCELACSNPACQVTEGFSGTRVLVQAG